jgi:hypothetical protein
MFFSLLFLCMSGNHVTSARCPPFLTSLVLVKYYLDEDYSFHGGLKDSKDVFRVYNLHKLLNF